MACPIHYNTYRIRHFRCVAAAFTLLLLAPAAPAVPLYYQLASGSVAAHSTEPGLVVDTSVKPTVAGTYFTLNDNGTFTFNFFDIWTNEPKINSDDLAASPISATLNFVDPFTASTINGITVGGSWFKGLSQWGDLKWNGPVTVSLSGDRVFQINLSDVTFNSGFGGLNEGTLCGATVTATVTQISSVIPAVGKPVPDNPVPDNPVPDGGATALLLATGLAGLRFFKNALKR